ncbi:MAG: outer membrane protein assembly factor BamB family protein [Armatimonadota bacterium]
MTDSRKVTVEERADEYSRSMLRAMIISVILLSLFTLSILTLMIVNHYKLNASDPRNSVVLTTLKAGLHKAPTNEKLKAEIRLRDAELRSSYLGRLQFAHTGSYLLLIGIGGLLITINAAYRFRKRVLILDTESPQDESLMRTTDLGRKGIVVFGVLLTSGLIALSALSQGDLTEGYKKAISEYKKHPPADFTSPGKEMAVSSAPAGSNTSTTSAPAVGATSGSTTSLPVLPPMNTGATGMATGSKPGSATQKPADKPSSLAVEAAYDTGDYSPSLDDFNQNWPVFRGPKAGIASGSYPDDWNGATGKNILWKTDLPLSGWNSPVVWKDRVFIAGADKQTREIYCIDASSGKMIWKKTVEPIAAGKAPEVFDDTGYAASTLAVDGKRVFAIFPNGDVVGYSFDGDRLWGRNLGNPDSMYGYASSLTMYKNLLIVQYDHGSGSDGKSSLIALQGGTGKIVWVTKRPVANSWTSPIVVNNADHGMVVTSANPWVMGYDALSGSELWRASIMSGDVAPSPAFANGIAYVCNTGAVLAAIRTDGKGDVTKTNILWQASDGLPDITSPATNGDLVLLLTTEGTLTCYDAKDGKKLWDHAFEATFRASPIIVGNRVYILDSEGTMHILALGRNLSEISKQQIGENTNATPAFVDGRIYIRTEKQLICVGAK